jgi:hypothetical protein
MNYLVNLWEEKIEFDIFVGVSVVRLKVLTFHPIEITEHLKILITQQIILATLQSPPLRKQLTECAKAKDEKSNYAF